MLQNFQIVLSQIIASTQNNYEYFFNWIGLLFIIQLINFCFKNRLCVLGIYPRSFWGLPGIILTPFIHVNLGHAFMNSMGIIILGTLLAVNSFVHVIEIAIMASLIGGVLVWLFGRKMFHVGASGLVMGLAGALCVVAYEQSSFYAYFLAGLFFYFFEHLALNLVPGESGTSWEGHLFGFIGGIIAEHFHLLNL